MSALPLFDGAAGTAAKTRGMDKAAENRGDILCAAKAIAQSIAECGVPVSADDVYESLVWHGYNAKSLGNAWGSVFRGKQWQWVGWVKSTRISNHARMIRTWRLK